MNLISIDDYSKMSFDVIMFEGCSFVKRDGCLSVDFTHIELNDKAPINLGREVKTSCGHLGEYNLAFHKDREWQSVGVWQVSRHWKDEVDVELAFRSILKLRELADRYPLSTIYLDYWGKGPLYKKWAELLPDNVFGVDWCLSCGCRNGDDLTSKVLCNSCLNQSLNNKMCGDNCSKCELNTCVMSK